MVVALLYGLTTQVYGLAREPSLLEKHVMFFQGANYNSDYICVDDTARRLAQLGFIEDRFEIAYDIIGLGVRMTGEIPHPDYRGLCMYKPWLLGMVHPPVDTGVYKRDGSIGDYTRMFEPLYQSSYGIRYIPKHIMFGYLQHRSGVYELNTAQMAEFARLYRSLEYFTRLGRRDSPHLLEADVIALYEGTLFYDLIGEIPPWQVFTR